MSDYDPVSVVSSDEVVPWCAYGRRGVAIYGPGASPYRTVHERCLGPRAMVLLPVAVAAHEALKAAMIADQLEREGKL